MLTENAIESQLVQQQLCSGVRRNSSYWNTSDSSNHNAVITVNVNSVQTVWLCPAVASRFLKQQAKTVSKMCFCNLPEAYISIHC